MRKVYGQSDVGVCPFCGKNALAVSKQGIPVCTDHKNKYLDLKCVCGEHLNILKGKYGPFCTCMNCGTMSLRKAMDMN